MKAVGGDIQTVFVLDDDEAVRDSLGALLESDGFEVATFGSGAEFLDRFDPVRGGCLVLDCPDAGSKWPRGTGETRGKRYHPASHHHHGSR